jgi:DNA helicase II / ATP-dependent DNA helicase PcrA
LHNDDDNDGMPFEKEYVQLMTLHNAKGLEFPNVFISGLEENLCPLVRKEEETDPAAIEEERRLLYVGMTRAKQNLFLFGAEQRSLYGRVVQQQPSRFLKEIPSEYTTAPAGKNHTNGSGKINRISSEKRYKPGDRVRHPSLGSGTVLQCSGTGSEARISIHFDRAGRKKLIVGLANLVRLN